LLKKNYGTIIVILIQLIAAVILVRIYESYYGKVGIVEYIFLWIIGSLLLEMILQVIKKFYKRIKSR
jgi:uncharacterized membrane protein YeaQ/YmgE (transglycosylase-associated protein family)